MNWNALTGVATVATALAAMGSAWAAIFAVKKQNENFEQSSRDFRLSLSAELALKLDDRFNSDEFRRSRSIAARALLRQDGMNDAEDVLDFFESVGLFMKSGALNEEVAYSFFFHWINLYWNAAQGHIQAKKRENNAAWQDLEYAYKRVVALERKKDKASADLALLADRTKRYLEDEIALDSAASRYTKTQDRRS